MRLETAGLRRQSTLSAEDVADVAAVAAAVAGDSAAGPLAATHRATVAAVVAE